MGMEAKNIDHDEPTHDQSFSITTGERKKPVFSKSILGLLYWHIWSVSSVIVTIILVTLNLIEYTIGNELGSSSEATANQLGALQLAAKAHETLILLSLANIARQWIQGSLITSGTLLGLLGAEKSMASLALPVSPEYIAAVVYSFTGVFKFLPSVKTAMTPGDYQRRKTVFWLVLYLFVACFLCVVAGPASAVLMIPRRDWFFDREINRNITEAGIRRSGWEKLDYYPNILIDPRLGNGVFREPLFSSGYLYTGYWRDVWRLKGLSENYEEKYQQETHRFENSGQSIVVNSSTSWDRLLLPGEKWSGETRLFAPITRGVIDSTLNMLTYKEGTKIRGAKVNFAAELNALDMGITCRRQQKQACPWESEEGQTLSNSTYTGLTESDELRNRTEWCYMSVNKNTEDGVFQSSRNLLLLTDHITNPRPNSNAPPEHNKKLPRFWVTEGPRLAKNERFAESLVFIFEEYVYENKSREEADTVRMFWNAETETENATTTTIRPIETATTMYTGRGEEGAISIPDIGTEREPGDELFYVTMNYDDNEDQTTNGLLTVCTISTALKSATATSSHQVFLPERVEYHDYLEFNDKSGSNIKESARQIIYHENWLDMLHEIVGEDLANYNTTTLQSFSALGPPTYTPRWSLFSTQNPFLRDWAEKVVSSATFTGYTMWAPILNSKGNISREIQASVIETSIGGAFMTMMLRMHNSNSQYSMSIVPGLLQPPPYSQTYPAELLIEEMRNYTTYRLPDIRVYHYIYGFRLSSKTGVLSTAFLLVHAVIAVAGSIWMCKQRRVIIAWNSTPEYAALCLGSEIDCFHTLKNTCAGIERRTTFETVVKIGETTTNHLELAIVDGEGAHSETHIGGVDVEGRYGCVAKEKHRRERRRSETQRDSAI